MLIGTTLYAASDKVYAISTADFSERWTFPRSANLLAAANRLLLAWTNPGEIEALRVE